MEILAAGLGLGESPRWHDGRLWVCDWTAGEVLSFTGDGARRVEQRVAGLPFSIAWLADGRAALTTPDGVLLDGRMLPGTAGRGWNEIVVHPGGTIYVNEIGFDLMAGEAPAGGSIWAVRADGVAREVATDLRFPNGMAITPDGGTLLVAESYAECLTAFEIGPDGGLARRRVWADVGGDAPDGLCLDADGAAWVASVPGRCCLRVAEGGRLLDRVETDRGCFACMLGGDDGRTLFVTAAEWGGTAGMGGRTGQVLTHPAPAPHAGHP